MASSETDKICYYCGSDARDDCIDGDLYRIHHIPGSHKSPREYIGVCPNKSAKIRAKRIARNREYSGVPGIYLEKSFNNYDPADNQKALEIVRTWAENPVGFVFLWGPVGVGKTHLICASLLWIIENGGNGKYRSMPSVIASSMPSSNPKTDIIKETIDLPIISIDDLGAGRQTDYVKDCIFRLINERCNEGMPTIIASNWSLLDMASQGVEWKSIADRITGQCRPDRFVEMKGKTRR